MAQPPKRAKVRDTLSSLATLHIDISLDAHQLSALSNLTATELVHGRVAVPLNDDVVEQWLASEGAPLFPVGNARRAWLVLAGARYERLIKTWHGVLSVTGHPGAANTTATMALALNLSVVQARLDGVSLSTDVLDSLADLGASRQSSVASLEVNLREYGFVEARNPGIAKVASALCRYVSEHGAVPPYTRPFEDRQLLLNTKTWTISVESCVPDKGRQMNIAVWPDASRPLEATAREIYDAVAFETSLLAPIAHPTTQRGLYYGVASDTDSEMTPLVCVFVANRKVALGTESALFGVNVVSSTAHAMRGSHVFIGDRPPPLAAIADADWKPEFVEVEAIDAVMVRDTIGDIFGDIDPVAESDKLLVWRRVVRLYCLLAGPWMATHGVSDNKVVSRYKAAISPNAIHSLGYVSHERQRALTKHILSVLNSNPQGHVLVLVPPSSLERECTLRLRLAKRMFPTAPPTYQKKARAGLLQRVLFGHVGQGQSLARRDWLSVCTGSLAVLLQTTEAEWGGLLSTGMGLKQPIRVFVAGELERVMVRRALTPGGILTSESIGQIQLAARMDDGC